MKTARWTTVVEKCGRPAFYLAWSDPAKDPALKRLVNETRVMTLHQELRGTRKDFGTVGLHRDRHAQLLVFPKSLRRFQDHKVVGVDYSGIAEGHHAAGKPVKLKPPPARAVYRPEPATHPVVAIDDDDDEERTDAKAERGAPAPARRRKAPAASQPKRTAEAPKPALQAKARPTYDELFAAVRAAVRDLRGGKAVRAYDRLRALTGE